MAKVVINVALCTSLMNVDEMTWPSLVSARRFMVLVWRDNTVKRPPEIAPTMIGITEVTMSNSMRVNPFSPRAGRRGPRIDFGRQPPHSFDRAALRKILPGITLPFSLFTYPPPVELWTVRVKDWVVVPPALVALIVMR